MRVPELEVHQPEGLQEALELLTDLPDSRPLAGGTELIPELKNQARKVAHLISLNWISELKGISMEDGFLRVGALVKQREWEEYKEVPQGLECLTEAIQQIASPAVRSIATIGGNLTGAVPSADIPPLLIGFGAKVSLISLKGLREVPLEDFFIGPRTTLLKNGEILKTIHIPLPSSPMGGSYLRFGPRAGMFCAVAGSAAVLKRKGSIIASARIVLSAVAPTPLLAKEASQFLAGKEPSEKVIYQAGEIASRECKPITDVRGSAEFRRHLVKILTTEAIKSAFRRAGGMLS